MTTKADRATPKDFESALAELEALVTRMEGGQLSLEESLAAYRRGVELIAYCQRTLEAAEQQVRVLDNGVLQDLRQTEARDDDSGT
ncbi:MAG: exodeoxyribonuclease VII small subunit [Thiobacillaceae bacterium]|nr:exodeoxyribonuclease VII small subunit [Thiobacillaceae bacterium]MCX7672327.1 exodeoxyribonuclease VII small subunit [Thiobacillaceae bacterium]